ncbi:MAG: nicotinate (nicotinamide) nucleotide adenylyltransferase [Clostridia bacterium]|nr:nicotinate (nicotinamide) nucleotide adenylyltransferase [Clostridia bacterium]
MRIGIFGGTFNPPHKGHKRMALEMMKEASLDKILIIPTFTPPHKTAPDLASGKDRLKMCELLFSEECFTVTDIELQRKGKSYTVDTLSELKKIYPDDELFLIIGSDMLLTFHEWRKPEEILTMVTLCVATRENGISPEALSAYAKETLKLSDGDYILSRMSPMECSSTDVREMVKNKENLSSVLTDEVVAHIEKFDLYSAEYPEYKALLREMLDDYRYIHSLGVAESARELAEIYNYDSDKAYKAGLLHDIMKNATKDYQLQIMEKGGIILSRAEKNNPKLWHAMAGECYLREEMGITDEELLGAVRYHTTGKEGMNLLQKIVYIADYISKERDYPDVDVMRRLSKEVSLEEASLYALRYSIRKFESIGGIIHTDSVDYYNELIIEKMRKEEF